MIYLASPIDFSPNELALGQVTAALRRSGHHFFCPATAWSASIESASVVNEINDHALSRCDALLAVLSARTVGVPMEIQAALSLGMPVGVIGDKVDISVPLKRDGIKILDFVHDVEIWAKTITPRNGQPQSGTPAYPHMALVQRDPIYAYGLELPAQKKAGDIGCDLTVSRPTDFGPKEWGPVPCDISVLAPSGFWFMIVGRSSSLVKRNLLVVPSVIDGGFTGRLYCMAHNLSNSHVTIERGERIAQLLPLPLTRVVFNEVEKLPDTERGDSGFGSTGQ